MRDRGLDFARTDEVFAGPAISFQDSRRDYSEVRMVTVGLLDDRITMVVWTQRGSERRIISMRHCNEREQRRFEAFVARR